MLLWPLTAVKETLVLKTMAWGPTAREFSPTKIGNIPIGLLQMGVDPEKAGERPLFS